MAGVTYPDGKERGGKGGCAQIFVQDKGAIMTPDIQGGRQSRVVSDETGAEAAHKPGSLTKVGKH